MPAIDTAMSRNTGTLVPQHSVIDPFILILAVSWGYSSQRASH
jgi:hypothetical protein